jgi:hypothetical protein
MILGAGSPSIIRPHLKQTVAPMNESQRVHVQLSSDAWINRKSLDGLPVYQRGCSRVPETFHQRNLEIKR